MRSLGATRTVDPFVISMLKVDRFMCSQYISKVISTIVIHANLFAMSDVTGNDCLIYCQVLEGYIYGP